MLTRRELLATGAALAVAPVRADEKKQPVIDSHTHFYDPTRKGGVPWPGKGDKVLYRPVLPGEFAKLTKPHGVTGTVVVEASPLVEDNQWLLNLAKDNPIIVGVVGRLLFTDAEFGAHLKRFAKNPLFRGIRANASEAKAALEDAKQLDRIKALSDTGLTLDLNGGADTFVVAARVAEKVPKLHVVVNHMGNPLIDGKEPHPEWLKALKTGADAGATVFCKFSALVDGTRKRDGAPTDPAFYKPVADAVWKAFGPERLLFGSNWPVSDLYAKYETVFALASKCADAHGAKARAAALGATATKAYRLQS
jgi:predicted TIM-barrel fold metal-dependent hydrolase